jgi:ferritin-like metal-binding protein YciE
MNTKQLEGLLLQSLEHELGGREIYRTAIGCARNPDLKQEWEKYLGETERHIAKLTEVCQAFGLDPEEETPGRAVVRHVGKALVEAMRMASSGDDEQAAELVACECVVLAETKDHLDWSLLGKCAQRLRGKNAEVLAQAYEEMEDQEDEHLYHSKGWCRELWIESLGMDGVLPPPEEERHVKTAIGAARAEQAADRER